VLKVDLHAHSLFSGCGLHTVVEMLTYAKNAGLEALAITDHGPAINGKISSPFFDRLSPDVVKGIRLLKGQESNVKSADGEIDFPVHFLRFTDIVLLGLHPNLDSQPKRVDYTVMLMSALKKNPYVDVITHINDNNYPVDFDRVVAAAKELGMAIEFNNAKVLYRRVPEGSTERLIESCKRIKCRAVISGDAHALHEIGLDDSIRPLLEKASFPKELIVNETAQGAFDFIEERRKVKQTFCGGRVGDVRGGRGKQG
jgi:putative hydrolase